MPRILSVWLPFWPIRRRTASSFWPDDTPRATVEEALGQRRIQACSEEATRLGVKPSQNLTQALAVCPELILDQANLDADIVALADMARWSERISPLTAPNPPDGLWIDISGCAHLLGGELQLATHLQKRLAPCKVAIADTAGAAWALARATTGTTINIAPAGEHEAKISHLPLEALRLDSNMVADLARVGLHRVESLLNLPRAELEVRFGPQLILQLDRALGTASEPIVWQRQARFWYEHCPFMEPISTAESLANALRLLSTRLCQRLEDAGLGGLRFRACFMRLDNEAQELCVVTARPLRSAARLTKLMTDQLDKIEPGFGIEAITLEAEEISGLLYYQPTLDEQIFTDDLAELIDTMINRLGSARIWRPMQVATHIPERAVGGTAALQNVPPWKIPVGPRPIRLLSPPEPIEAVTTLTDDPPHLFRWRSALHRIRAASGPERISGEWWRDEDFDEKCRDYYFVEDQYGGRFWIFREISIKNYHFLFWYLHGIF